eukprot:2170727-Alexandrium_andersonii.AAC.1
MCIRDRLRAWRPDLRVHVVVENASSLHPRHAQAMRLALAIPALTDVEWRVEAGRWSAFHRARLFLSTMASPKDTAFPPPRPL